MHRCVHTTCTPRLSGEASSTSGSVNSKWASGSPGRARAMAASKQQPQLWALAKPYSPRWCLAVPPGFPGASLAGWGPRAEACEPRRRPARSNSMKAIRAWEHMRRYDFH